MTEIKTWNDLSLEEKYRITQNMDRLMEFEVIKIGNQEYYFNYSSASDGTDEKLSISVRTIKKVYKNEK